MLQKLIGDHTKQIGIQKSIKIIRLTEKTIFKNKSMMLKKMISGLLIMAIFTVFVETSCKTTHGKGGTRQPKKGPMPCPIKDC
ncbi:MAG: hypothetical protein SFY32_07605 [Bacteroidota bacterium]|nr:hypothetical protein [Bacteroidota bacterium]